MVDFSEHLKRANIKYAYRAKVDRRILPALIHLTGTPGQRGFVLGRVLPKPVDRNNSRDSLEIIQQTYDPSTQLLGLTVRAPDGYSRRVHLELPPSKVREAREYIARYRTTQN